MSNIPRVSLEDSLYVIQLARETALAQNRQAQAKRMAPLVEEMRSLISMPPQSAAIPPSTGVMGQSDFKTLLNVTQSRVNQTPTVDSAASIMDRNRLIGAMSEANMTDVDIARQFSITREEVQLVLNVQQKNKNYGDRLR
jgi:cell pole-organizing protein PopZ